jgi:signal transduction histidine kinase
LPPDGGGRGGVGHRRHPRGRRGGPLERAERLSFLLEARVLGQAVREQAGITCTLAARLPDRLPEDQEIVLYRVAQEALTNVARHARASRARVELTETPGGVVLEVHDDGVGFDPATELRGSLDHFGLAGMRERVELAGGTWTVWSRPGAGTVLTATLPRSLVAA